MTPLPTGPGNQVNIPTGAFTDRAVAALLGGPYVPITVSGAINPHLPGKYVVIDAAAAALTLGAPTAGADDGVLIEVLSATAYAHTITTPAAGDIRDGNTSDHDTVMTFNAHIGALCILEAYQGVWYVRAEVGCSLSS
jgi:hypothetical protein